jgi:DNA-binding NarL/FixJ family response regulator
VTNAAENGRIRVLIVDDHALMREGLSSLLAREGLEVAGAAASGDEGVRLAAELQPDIVLMDVSMPGLDGIASTAALLKALPGSRVIGLSIRDDAETGEQMKKAGALTTVSKCSPADELVSTIRRLAVR